MDINKFSNSPIGDLIPITGIDGRSGESYNHVAFAAHPLGPSPSLSTGTWNAVSRASLAIGRLQQGSVLVANPSLLRRPTLRREAQSTSALEGTYAPLEEVLAADVIVGANRSSALNEVLNFVQAAERGFDWIQQTRPITVGLLSELHRILVFGTPADNDEAGRVRRIQVVIGSRGGSIYDARFIPMPEGAALEAAVGDLVQWLRPENHSGIDPVVAAALAHYQFETLHPFNDGNGRIGRLLIVLQLVQDGILNEGLLSVSPWFEQRRSAYQELLAQVSATGDWNSWITFFAEGIEASAIDTALRIEDLIELQSRYHETIRNAGARGLIRDIADFVIGNPYVTIPNLAVATGKTYQGVSTAVRRLVELGILEQLKAGGVMAFRAPEVVRIVSSPAMRTSR